MDNHQYELPEHTVECLVGVGAVASVTAAAGDALGQLAGFRAAHEGEWMFGHLGYGLAAETEPVAGRSGLWSKDSSKGEGGEQVASVRRGSAAGDLGAADGNEGEALGRRAEIAKDRGHNGVIAADRIGFPDLFFYIPEIVIELSVEGARIGSLRDDPSVIWASICGEGVGTGVIGELAAWQARFTRQEYLDTVEALRRHILRGDCYEINFCQEFYSQPARIDPVATWFALSEASPNPFGAFYRVGSSWLLCASPERYLRRHGDRLISQPIKGTSPRDITDPVADEAHRRRLFESAKDRSENVMVVDLVRNDLSRICLPNSVRVTELFGIYSFPQVHQMISTVEGLLPAGADLADVVRLSFPMGSMTGAPKRRVVELIGQYERSQRGLFSGSVGYVRPDGDLDLNVVIRSLLYNEDERYLSYQVGSGITFYSDPVQEYEECMVKAKGIKKALQ